jgi:vitamin B12 transporter
MALHRLLITTFGLFLALLTIAQDSVATQYHLPEVVIASEWEMGAGFSLTDSIDRISIGHEHLGSLLARKTGMYVMQYGPPGAAATVRWQGLAAAHTAVNWNGIPLTSRTLGIADLSLLPMAQFDQPTFHYAANSFSTLNTTIGGSLNMNSGTCEKGHTEVSSSFNTMNNHQQALEYSTGGDGIVFSGNAMWQNNANRFRYRDVMKYGQPWEIQTSAPGYHLSAQQSMHYTSPNGKQRWYATGWWNYRQTRLPDIMGNYGQSHQQQTDSALRIVAGWQSRKQSVQWAFTDEFQRYTDRFNAQTETYSIDSRLRIRQGIAQWNGMLLAHANSVLHAVVQGHAIHILNTNYSDGFAREIYPAAGLNYEKKGKVLLRMTGRYEHRSGFKNFPAAGIRIEKEVWKSSAPHWRLNGSLNLQHKFRVPDFNERFWVTGAQGPLRPERGWHLQTGFSARRHFNSHTIETSVIGFTHFVNDWIQWLPTENGRWTPHNFKTVHSSGIMTDMSWQKKLPKGILHVKLGYQWNKVIGKNGHGSDSFTMTYSPKNMANGQLTWSHRTIDVSIANRYIGKRYTEEANREMLVLAPVALCDVRMGYALDSKRMFIRLQFHIDNIGNIQYQTVRSYAMPGRVLGGGLSIQFKHN